MWAAPGGPPAAVGEDAPAGGPEPSKKPCACGGEGRNVAKCASCGERGDASMTWDGWAAEEGDDEEAAVT
jgi:hypothetical protein